MKTVSGESYEQWQAKLAASLFEKLPVEAQDAILDVVRTLVARNKEQAQLQELQGIAEE